MSGWPLALALCALMLFASLLGLVAFHAHHACESKGGVLVRGGVCVDRKAVIE